MSEIQVAQALLSIGAVSFTPHELVTFKSGMLSPVYVDNRRLIAHPEQWHIVIEAFLALIEREQLTFDLIAGIETAGIPHSSALAYILHKPSVFVRKQAKEHGKKRRIEGGDVSGKRILLIEDLITTGGSSLSGVSALRDSGAAVEDCMAITSFGFNMARAAFAAAGVHLHTLTSFTVIAAEAMQQGLMGQAEMEIIQEWLDDPHTWANKQEIEIERD